MATSFGLGGATIGQVTLNPGGSGATGILSASGAFVTEGFGSLVAIALSVSGSDQVQLVTSTNGGATFSSPRAVGVFSSTQPNPALSSLGDSQLSSPFWTPGQLGLTSIGSGLFLAFPSLSSGQTELLTESSGNAGVTWQGPFESAPIAGSIQNLTVSPSPAGLAYVTWANRAWGSGGGDEAIFFSDGSALLPPSPIPGVGGAGPGLAGPPSLTVDSFQRPLIAWPVSNATTSGVAYTGDFLSANQSLAQVDQMVNDPLVGGDFPSGGGPSQQAAFNSSVANAVSTVSSSLSSNKLCNAQNATALSLYQNLTHLPLSIIPGSGTVCSSKFSPNNKTSPIANIVGVNAPNTYLAVYSDWLLESLGVPLASSPLSNATSPWGPSANPAPPPSSLSRIVNFTANSGCFPGFSGWSTCSGQESVNVLPLLYDPTSFGLQATASFPSSSYTLYQRTCAPHFSPPRGWNPHYSVNYTLVKTWTNISINNGTVHPFTGSGFYPSPYVSNITANSQYYWSVTLSPRYQLQVTGTWCGVGAPPSAPFTASKTSFSGEVKTTLATIFTSHSWHATYTSTSNNAPVSLTFASGTNLGVVGNATISDSSNGGKTVGTWTSWPAGFYLPGTFGFSGFTGVVGHTYQVNVVSTSRPGHWTPPQAPSFSYDTPPQNSTAQTSSWSFSFTLTRPSITLWGWQVSNITATTAQLTWYATANAAGYVTYATEGGGSNITDSGIAGKALSNETSWKYSIELHGLEPWAFYQGSYGVVASTSTYTYSLGQAFPSFQTQQALNLWETDNLYDSITRTGGGAQFHWSLPPAVAESNPAAQISSGTLTIWNSTQTLSIPISPTEVVTNPSSPWYNTLNVSLTGFNTSYGAALQLNYTGSPNFSACSQDYTFAYQSDSSGDGLTNLEKQQGWWVTGTNQAGGPFRYFAWASPSLYSTNGLVSDYLEKEYGLSPGYVDSAGSQMLDTWNLTFNIGPANGNLPSNFKIWYENGTYNPFATTVPYSPGKYESGSPALQNISNLTPTPSHGITSGDGSPLAATYLWSYSAFQRLTALDPWGIRAVEGSWKGVTTLTVWGKLSSGANPLAQSTPNDGIVDGTRINPALDERLSITVSNLFVGTTGTQSGALPSGQGYAVAFQLFAGPNPNGPLELTNYSAPVNLLGQTNRLTGYTVVLPVSQTVQYETLVIQVIANLGSSEPKAPIPFANGGEVTATTTYDMLSGRSSSMSFGDPGGSPYNGSLSLTLQAVPVGVKTPTYLWLPTGNSTVNGLPAGLERYTGEQAFDLVLVNSSSTITSDSVLTPWGGTYQVTLQTGLNNLLFPREQFLDSPLGQAILLGQSTSYSSTAGAPPLVGANEQSLIDGFEGANWMVDLGAYWQNRVIASGPGTITGATEGGTPSISNYQVQVATATTPAANNTGGLPSNPTLYNASDTPAALQSIVTLNVTSTDNLDLLLAGLLDNTTGGVNGTFQGVTTQVASLGLPQSVTFALANVTIPTQGLYGPPPNNQPPPPPPPPSSSLWGDFCNAVTSVVETVVGAIVSLPAIVYNSAVATYTYLNHIAHEAAAVGGAVLQRTAAALEAVGKLILSALNALLQWIIIHVIDPALSAVIDPIEAGVGTYDSNMNGPLKQAWASENSSGSVGQVNAISFANAFVDGAPFEIAIGIGVVVTIALSLLTPFDLGPSFAVGIVIGLIAGAVLASIGSLSGAAQLSGSAVDAIENLVNPIKSFPSTEWGTLAGVFGLLAAGEEVPWSWYVLSQAVVAQSSDTIFTAAAWVMALALTALVIGAIAVASANGILLLLAFVMSCVALFGVTYHFLTQVAKLDIPPLTQLGWVDVGLSASAMFGSATDLGINLSQLQQAF